MADASTKARWIREHAAVHERKEPNASPTSGDELACFR